ncbi:unnamed protein product [Clavelina lepadiformis]|uniref:EamA domain-containing protein n=1 Tax=Clavelina lepadiformis TaxID=159417 RepID=A0ABP0FEH7_CLALP
MKSSEDTSSTDAASFPANESKRTHHRWLGYIFMVSGSLCIAFAGILLKGAKEATKTHMLLLRCILQYLMLVPVLTYRKTNVLGPDVKTFLCLLGRGLFGSVSGVFFYSSLNILTFGNALAIFYTSPAMIGILACIFLKETCNVLRIILTIVTFVGLMFVVQPPFIFGGTSEDTDDKGAQLEGCIMALTAAVLLSIVYVILRKLGPGIHYTQSLFYYSTIGCVVVTVQLKIAGESLIPCRHHLLILSGSALLSSLGQIFETLALQRADAGPIASVGTSQLVLAFILEYLILGVTPSLYSCIGAALILIATVAQTLEATRKSTKCCSK